MFFINYVKALKMSLSMYGSDASDTSSASSDALNGILFEFMFY